MRTSEERVAVVVSPEASGDDRTVELAPIVAPTRRRVLLVEPNCHRRPALANELRNFHSLATTSGIQGALRLLGQERFDAVIALHENDGEGLPLLAVIAREWPTMRRLLTSRWHDAPSKRALRAGVVHALLDAKVDVATLAIEVCGGGDRCAGEAPKSSGEPRRRARSRFRPTR